MFGNGYYMLDIENKIKDLQTYFKANSNILAVWIIGSYKTKYQTEDSDIDIAILLDKNISLLDEMSLSCNISDIINFEDVDIINLTKAPITLQFKTLKEGRQIYEGDFLKLSDYMEWVFNRYRDEKFRMESFIKDYYDSFNL